VLGLITVISESNGQIPANGFDIPSLSNVHWGMTIYEVKELLKSITDTNSDSTLRFEDSFLQSKVGVILTFGKHPDFEGLRTVEVQFDDTSLGEKLFLYLKARYGEQFESMRQEKTKLFLTVQLDSKKWTLDNESVVLIEFSKGSDIFALNLLYRATGKDRK